mgnify:CR=1 FL=1
MSFSILVWEHIVHVVFDFSGSFLLNALWLCVTGLDFHLFLFFQSYACILVWALVNKYYSERLWTHHPSKNQNRASNIPTHTLSFVLSASLPGTNILNFMCLFLLGFFFVMSASIAVLRCGMPPNKQLLYPQLHCSSGVVAKNPPASVGDMGSISRLGRSSGGGNGNPLHYSCLEESHGQRSLAGYSP